MVYFQWFMCLGVVTYTFFLRGRWTCENSLNAFRPLTPAQWICTPTSKDPHFTGAITGRASSTRPIFYTLHISILMARKSQFIIRTLIDIPAVLAGSNLQEQECIAPTNRRLIRAAILNLDITNCRPALVATVMNNKYFKFPGGWMINILHLFAATDPLFKYFWQTRLFGAYWLVRRIKQFASEKRGTSRREVKTFQQFYAWSFKHVIGSYRRDCVGQ